MPLPEPQITRYLRWLRDTRGLQFADYDTLWRWSVTDLEAFWLSMWQYFGIQSPTPFARVLSSERMPGARWFEGAQVNYARVVLRHVEEAHAAGHPAIVFADEPMLAAGRLHSVSWPQLRARVAASASTCPTGRRRPWCSWRARASAQSGRSVRPTWVRWLCSTAFAISSRRC